ncbi:MAG: iron ABC transporter permease [Planctomycetota bacterium]|nr:iron ABC transporter permease [Planctomycetota bacterium]
MNADRHRLTHLPRVGWGKYVLAGMILAVFGVFLLWPIGRVLRVGFFGMPGEGGGFTLRYVSEIFLDSTLRAGLVNSLMIAVMVTGVCIVISVPLAMMSVRYEFWGQGVIGGLLLVPLILPPFVGAIGMRQILGRFGVLTSVAAEMGIVGEGVPVAWFGGMRILGVVLVEALSLYPIVYLNVAAALANVDPAMEQAAANLGASRWRVFWKITLPLMRPGLFAGGTLVLIWSFTELGTPLMFDFYRVTPVQVFFRLTQVSGSPVPYALVVVMMLGSVALYAAGKLALGRGHDAAVTKASVASSARRLSVWGNVGVVLVFGVVIGLALLPHVGVILTSVSGVGSWYQSMLPKVFTMQHYAAALTHDVTVPSVANSVTFASLSMVLDVVLGLIIAWVVVRSKLPGRGLIDGLAMLPLAVPGLVLAFGYLAISFQLQGWFKDVKWLRELVDVQENPTLLLVLAYAMRRLPYVVRSAVAGLEQTPVDLELAAKNMGASTLTTMRRITVPLIGANLVAGALLAFAFAMLEVSDSLILAQRATYWPITKAIYDLFQRLGDGPYIACALGVWAMALLTLTILSANAVLGKRMGAIFRV